MLDKIGNTLNISDLKDTIKAYYGYDENKLREHWSKWKEVEALNQQDMINHDDINDLITENYKQSYQPLTNKQKTIQTEEFLKIIDILVEPVLISHNKMKK